MKKEFKSITDTTFYQQWWDEELSFENKKGKYGINIFGEWLLKPIFDDKIDLRDYNEELLFLSENYYAYYLKDDHNICVYLSDYQEAECFTFINHSDYNKIGFWGFDDAEGLTAVLSNYFYVFRDNGLYGYKDYRGNVIIEPVYKDFNKNYLISKLSLRDEKTYILMDKYNKWGSVKLVNIVQKRGDVYATVGYKFQIVVDFQYEKKGLVEEKLKK